MTTIINASPTNGLVQTADGSGVIKLQSNGVTTNALAWVNFNGTTSPGTVRAQYNVSSVTKNGTGDYTINYSTALSDANYTLIGTTGTDNGRCPVSLHSAATYLAASTRIRTLDPQTSAGVDQTIVAISVFGN